MTSEPPGTEATPGHVHPRDRRVRFCSACGGMLEPREFEGRLRPVCPACGYIHFTDPKLVVAVLAEHDNRLLLQRRTRNPGKGGWTFPAGFADAGEVLESAAAREAWEETSAEVRVDRLVGVYSEPGDVIVLVAWAGTVLNPDGIRANEQETDSVGLFPLDALPPLAFPRDQRVLQDWQAGRG